MTNKDEQIWQNYTRSLTPVTKKARKPSIAKAAPEKTAARKSEASAPAALPKLNATSQIEAAAFQALERKREKALRQGEIEIDAKLDLHGMTQIVAFENLCTFMRRAVKAGKRQLLIVTGKGPGGTGVLRGSLETWLGQLPEAAAILAIRPAAPKHGGGGAFYVLLRKSIAPATHF